MRMGHYENCGVHHTVCVRPTDCAEIASLTAALSEAQGERDALKGEVEKLRREKDDLLDTKPRRDRMFDAEAWDGAMDALGKMTSERDAAVKRAEEAERSADILQNAHRGTLAASVRASQEAEAAKRLLALAERVVEAAEKVRSQRAIMGSLDAVFSLGAALGGLRDAVAEYRKAVGE